MKALFLLLMLTFCFTNCETKKNDKITHKKTDTTEIKSDSIVLREYKIEELQKEVPKINLSKKDSVNKTFNILIKGSKNYSSLNKSKIFYCVYPVLNKLYFLDKIKKGITIKTENNLEISEIYYENKFTAEEVFENLKKQLTDKNNEFEKGNYFFDYFKRGTVYILEDNKIISIIYNPFTYPKTDKTIDLFLSNNDNNNKFKFIIRTYMIGSYEQIK
ncbi:hypothetical protein NG800_018490 [Epilithonimonas ginsengisoli]|uniref:Lipoprotein n=1 Tax=Epilithonimonas ginsengisoli TaxID=1245592 RepID=A0ABU4JMP3_9FLAO|nr:MULTISPECIES: hypothetical protein [Chryseobacterium group]MBV6881763.1 hypothetical protein [Epilithonimonas sp. FP105]MDW8550922.1 hypothetical protein [Epilithonimonas ginsengisoli]OAH66489.1 hypothetical protein AXA65_17955 [Chryseobacterium sp. FP211-J200]